MSPCSGHLPALACTPLPACALPHNMSYFSADCHEMRGCGGCVLLLWTLASGMQCYQSCASMCGTLCQHPTWCVSLCATDLLLQMPNSLSWFPLGTFLANQMACVVDFVVWVIMLWAHLSSLQQSMLYGFVTGFSGCLSTVSTWVVEVRCASIVLLAVFRPWSRHPVLPNQLHACCEWRDECNLIAHLAHYLAILSLCPASPPAFQLSTCCHT